MINETYEDLIASMHVELREAEARIAKLQAALLFALPVLEEECRPGAPVLVQAYAALAQEAQS
jgi:hypothetical protein